MLILFQISKVMFGLGGLFSHCPISTKTTKKHCFLSSLLRPFPLISSISSIPFSPFRSLSVFSTMDSSGVLPIDVSKGTEVVMDEEYSSISELLREFTDISSIDKAWTFKSKNGSQAMFQISQPNLLANKKRKYILSSHITAGKDSVASFQSAPFPTEITGVSTIVPSPSGSKLLVIRNPENDSPTRFEIWDQSQVEKEFHIPQSIHGSVYTDGWFEGISWNAEENLIAYIAEEPAPLRPTFTSLGFQKSGSAEKDSGSWKGQGFWEEDWGETYAGKRQPALFVINITSGEVRPVDGVGRSLSVGQVVWAPPTNVLQQDLVFVGWPSDVRKLGMKYCYNRPCALYAAKSPFLKSEDNHSETGSRKDASLFKLTESISSAFIPRFSPDGKFLAFLSAKSSVDSGAHSATNSLHRIDWPTDGMLSSATKIVDVVPVVFSADDGCFPGLYCFDVLHKPWLSDGHTMILMSIWGSTQVILSIDLLSGKVSRVSPGASNYSWNVLTLDSDNIIAVCSSPVDIPQIQYGLLDGEASVNATWNWQKVLNPASKCSEKVRSMLASRQFSVIKIPVNGTKQNLTSGAQKPYEAIFVSSKSKLEGECEPMLVILHGGPHTVSVSSFSKSFAFLFSLGYSLLIVNYRGSIGFGEEALQSLPGNAGSQDVNDVLNAIDHVIDMGLADSSKIAVIGGSHGGFLTTHLIGQAPEKFVAACARNPVCNLALMVGITDIPEWCYVESFGIEGKSKFTEAPSAEDLVLFHKKSPIAHIHKVKTPTLLLLGAKDLRVPVSTGLQFGRALKEKGVEIKILMFPEDSHPLDRPQTDFESYVNIGLWFRKYCR
ncbi:serine protease [Lithospermum erythrorhizon]|uniref:acylaminoacyl-peptidase n=1 Tax=Lithospermum erythrorhizon TaxID=34254 RepID=A0AAV3QPK5_LITER